MFAVSMPNLLRSEAVQHGAKVIRAYGCHGRKADRRVHRVATAYPVPELEHVRRIDAELAPIGSRPTWRESYPGLWLPWSKGRSPSPSSSDRLPSPRTRTCSPYRCRTCSDRKPSNMARKLSGPMAAMVERPIAESIE